MARQVAYVVNAESLYMEMTKTSIHLLRQCNATIPVQVFLIASPCASPPADFLEFCDRWQVELVQHPSVSEAYFQDNKVCLAACVAERVLVLDADTFVFADVDELFDTYADADLAACTNDWVWETGYDAGFVPGSPVPLNSGVVLCSTRLLGYWTRRMPALHAALKAGVEYPALSDWLFRVSPSAYNREEWGLTICSSEASFVVTHFDERDCKLLKYRRLDQDLADFRSCTRIFHSYSQHWRQCLSYL